MTTKALGNHVNELLNLKERLIFHLIRTVGCGRKGEWGNEGYEALKFLEDLGYSKDGERWKFILDRSEPGTHVKPNAEYKDPRAEKIKQALFGMLTTLSTAIQGGKIGRFEQIDRAMAIAYKALE